MTSKILFARLRQLGSFLSMQSPYRRLVLSPVTQPRTTRIQRPPQHRDLRLTGPSQRYRSSR
jgi:hypothetical protein